MNDAFMYNAFFYESYESISFLDHDEILQKNPYKPLNHMVITPSVKAYMMNYFNCNNTNLGASL